MKNTTAIGSLPWQAIPATRTGTEEVYYHQSLNRSIADAFTRILLVLCFTWRLEQAHL